MATEQELRDRVATLEAAEKGRLIEAAVANELVKFELADGAADQLKALILPGITMTKLTDGREVLHSADYTPLPSVVAATLQRPEYGHFLKPKGSAGSAPAQPAPQPAAGTGGASSDARREILPGETFSDAIVRVARAKQATQGDPRLDPSLPFGIGRTLPR
jgi:hypothetical protein